MVALRRRGNKMSFDYQFSNEYRVCPNCGKIKRKQVLKNWKCPDCGKTLLIYATHDNHVYLRKLADDVKIGDHVSLPYCKDFYEVLDVGFEDGRYRIALKGYGVIKLTEEEWLNCVWGSWDGNVNGLKNKSK